MNRILLISLILLTASCSLLFPKDNSVLYTLDSIQVSTPLKASHKTLLVETPTVPYFLDRDRIALLHVPYQQDVFADIKWSAPLPAMLQHVLINTIADNKTFTVFSQHSSLVADYRLVTEVRNFQVEYGVTGTPITVHVTISASLIDASQQTLLMSKEFDQKETINTNTGHDIIEGFDKAFGEIQKGMMIWLISASK